MLAERLDLVRRLTAATPAWALLKGGASALDGRGDLDCVTPTAQVPVVRATIEEWSRDTGRGPVLACGHLPGTLVLAVVEPGPSTTLVQLDLFDHRLRGGAWVLRANDLLVATMVDPDGYRRLTPGAEAVGRFLLDEWRRGAPSPGTTAITALASLLAQDPAGAAAVKANLDRRLREAVDALAAGAWPRRRLALAELVFQVRALRAPLDAARRSADAPGRRNCPLLKALASERTVSGDVDEFLAAVRHAHRKPGYR